MPRSIRPYLNFNGDTREAMEFYARCLDGKLFIQKFSDAPGMPVPPGYEDKVLHASVEAAGIVIMASEGRPGVPVVFGDNVNLMLTFTALDEGTRVFNALSAGGTVEMPMEKQFWGAVFGSCTDKFGVHWMVTVEEG